MYKERMHAINKYLEFRKNVGLYRPNSNYLLSSGHDNVSKQCNHIQNEQYEHTRSQTGMGTQIHCALIFPSLNPPNLKLYQTIWLVMHMLYCLAISYFYVQDINTIQNAVTCTQGPCLVKAEENLFEYKQCPLLETIVTYMLSLRAKLYYAKHS